MPRVATFSGIVISMYAADHNPPHVHVYYAEHEALVSLDGVVLRGSVPTRQRELATAWIAHNRAALQQRWAALNP